MRTNRTPVAQVSKLLYRRLPVGRALASPTALELRETCGLAIRDTADWKSALRLTGAALLAFVAQVFNLLYRRLPVGKALASPTALELRETCGLAIRDTADWKSALHGSLRYNPC